MDQNTLVLDPDPEFWSNLDPDPGPDPGLDPGPDPGLDLGSYGTDNFQRKIENNLRVNNFR